MSASISILGNVGGSAELRYSNQGSAIASFSIASNSFKKSAEGNVQITEWYKVTAFGKLAETIAAHVQKGMQLLVLGRLSFSPWKTKDGDPRAGAEVILQSFEFAGGNRSNGSGGGNETVVEQPEYSGPNGDQMSAADGEAVTGLSSDVQEPFDNRF